MDQALAARAMILARFSIAGVALAAGILMIAFPTVEANLRINAAVAVINPILLTFINLVGFSGLSGKTPPYKLALVAAGALLIVLGTL